MPAIKLEQFGGMLPAWDPHLLPVGQAALSENGYLFSGALEGWRTPKLLRALQNTAARYVYRIPIINETQALAYLVFLGMPRAGDTVSIGEVTYTFQSSLEPNADGGNGAPADVLIATDNTTLSTALNIQAAITADNNTNANAGVLYGTDTTSNQDVFFVTGDNPAPDGLNVPFVATVNLGGMNYSFIRVGAVDFGAAYNNIAVSENTGGARLLWLKDVLSQSDTTTTYQGGSNAALSNQITAPSTWLEFLDQDTNVVKSQVVDDQFKRYYFASPSMIPSYNTYDRITAGMPAWKLGVPPPGCAPEVSVAGGGNNLTLGNYVSGGGQYVGNSNWIYLVPIFTPGATQIQDIKINMSAAGSDDSNAHWAGLIYEDDNGAPGGLLNVGEIITGVTVNGLNESTFLNPSNLLSNTKYWIGFMTDSIEAWGATNGGITNMVAFSNTFTNGAPATAPGAPELQTGLIGINMWGDFVSSDLVEARSYVYTWVSAYDEEGPPSPATLVNGWSNGTWTIGLWTPPADEQGVTRDLVSLNLYRTVTATGGTTTFFFVANLPIGTATYTDTAADNVVALNNQLESTKWFPPPENLQGMLAMPNGVIVGFVENQIWFSVPYRPHAWDPSTVLTVDFPIVGLGLTNGAVVVCTNATPYVISGNTPGTMAQTKCSEPNPCNSRASILSGDAAVSYMSPNGLIQVTATGVATNTTDLWFTREQWQALTPAQYGRAIYLASCYYCLGSTSPASVIPSDDSEAQQGFTIELDQDNTSFTIWPQPGGHRLGFNELLSPTGAAVDNVLTDPWTGVGIVVSEENVYYFDFSDPAPTLQTYTWTSKIYQQNTKKSYEAMKVFFTVPPGTPTLNPVRAEADPDDPSWTELGANQYAIIKTYVDLGVDGEGNPTGEMVLIDAREIRRSGELLRIVSGFKAEQWQWEIVGRVKISNVQIATTAKELANV